MVKLKIAFAIFLTLFYLSTVASDLTHFLNAYAKSKEGWSLETPNFEGVRVNLDDKHGNGWFLLRLSLHDPLLPLNIESNSVGGAKIIAKELVSFIENYDKLEKSSLVDFAK